MLACAAVAKTSIYPPVFPSTSQKSHKKALIVWNCISPPCYSNIAHSQESSPGIKPIDGLVGLFNMTDHVAAEHRNDVSMITVELFNTDPAVMQSIWREGKIMTDF